MNRMRSLRFSPNGPISRIGFRSALILSALWLVSGVGCKSSKNEDPPTNLVQTGPAEEVPEIGMDDDTRLVRMTERSVNQWVELNIQGRTTQAVALRLTIAQAVDDDFDTFVRIAQDAEMLLVRNMAVKCLGFAKEKRAEARDVLIGLFDDPHTTILGNAVYGVGVLADPETDLTGVIKLVGHSNPGVRTNAAWALKNLFIVIPTPRELTPQYFTAIQRLSALLHDPETVRGRRAGAWALAKMHHPETIDQLISALEDSDEQVQEGGLHGLGLLKDQRGIEPILAYLDKGPAGGPASWAKQALISIVVTAGLAQNAADLEALGTSPKAWRNYIRDARMR